MTPDAAYLATRDAFAAALHAQAAAQGLRLTPAQIVGMLETAMTSAGILPLMTAMAAADAVVQAWDDSGTPPPPGVEAARDAWLDQRNQLDGRPSNPLEVLP